MQYLEDKIRKEGKVYPGDILKVDSFLNHQMDISAFRKMSQEFKRLFQMPVQREETRRVRDRRDDDRRRRAGRDARRRKDCTKGKSPIWKPATHDPSSR